MLKYAMKLILLLCIPLLSLLIVLRFLLTWNLHWLDYAIGDGRRPPRAQRRAMLVLGVVLGLILLIPVLNLLLPALLCSSVCHLRFRTAQGAASNEQQLTP